MCQNFAKCAKTSSYFIAILQFHIIKQIMSRRWQGLSKKMNVKKNIYFKTINCIFINAKAAYNVNCLINHYSKRVFSTCY